LQNKTQVLVVVFFGFFDIVVVDAAANNVPFRLLNGDDLIFFGH